MKGCPGCEGADEEMGPPVTLAKQVLPGPSSLEFIAVV